MIEVCGYCKDTHGRHFLGCPHLVEAVKIDMWRIEHGLPAKRPGYYEAQRMPPRIDGVLQATEPVKEGDILVVNEGACTVSKVGPIYGSAPAALVQEELLDKLAARKKALANPKDIAGSKKPAYDLLALPHALNMMAKVLKHGADKYGPFNWRTIPIMGSAYYAAVGRHWAAMASGEWNDPESGMPHAAHIMATCAIMLDAADHGTLKGAGLMEKHDGQAKTN